MSPYRFGKIFKGELVFFVIEKKKNQNNKLLVFSHEINFTLPQTLPKDMLYCLTNSLRKNKIKLRFSAERRKLFG